MKIARISIIACLAMQCVFSQKLPENDFSYSSAFGIDGLVTTAKECLRQKAIVDCFKRKVIKRFDEELNSNLTIEVNDIMTIKRDPEWNAKNATNDTQRSFGINFDKLASSDLNTILAEKINAYLKSIIVQFSFNKSPEEGRKRKAGKGGAMMMYGALGFASIISQLFMGKLAMISGTALLMAKISLILALMSGLKKMTGGGGSGEHVVYSGGDHGGGGGWQRAGLAQDMAYRGYAVRSKKAEEPMPYMNYGYYQEGRNDLDFS